MNIKFCEKHQNGTQNLVRIQPPLPFWHSLSQAGWGTGRTIFHPWLNFQLNWQLAGKTHFLIVIVFSAFYRFAESDSNFFSILILPLKLPLTIEIFSNLKLTEPAITSEITFTQKDIVNWQARVRSPKVLCISVKVKTKFVKTTLNQRPNNYLEGRVIVSGPRGIQKSNSDQCFFPYCEYAGLIFIDCKSSLVSCVVLLIRCLS